MKNWGSRRICGITVVGAQILVALGVRKMKLITNNPKKIIGLEGYGIKGDRQGSPLSVRRSRKIFDICQPNVRKLGHLLDKVGMP